MKIIKNIVFILFFLILFVSSIGNIISQFLILNEAKLKNGELSNKISKLEKENNIIRQKINYSTDSAYIKQQGREKLALGDVNDKWIDIDLNNTEYKIMTRVNTVEKRKTIKEWINLFTQ